MKSNTPLPPLPGVAGPDMPLDIERAPGFDPEEDCREWWEE
jgi:hypothetical protein